MAGKEYLNLFNKTINGVFPFFFYITEEENTNFKWGERVIDNNFKQVFDHWGKGNIIYLYMIREEIVNDSSGNKKTELKKCKIIGGQLRPMGVGDEEDKDRHEDHTDLRYYYLQPSQFTQNIDFNYYFLASPINNLEIDTIDEFEEKDNKRLYDVTYNNTLHKLKFTNKVIEKSVDSQQPQHIFLPIYVDPIFYMKKKQEGSADEDNNEEKEEEKILIGSNNDNVWAYIDSDEEIHKFKVKDGKLFSSNDESEETYDKPILIEANNTPINICISYNDDIKNQIDDEENDITKEDFDFVDIHIFPDELIKQYRNNFNEDENELNDPFVPEPEVEVSLPAYIIKFEDMHFFQPFHTIYFPKCDIEDNLSKHDIQRNSAFKGFGIPLLFACWQYIELDEGKDMNVLILGHTDKTHESDLHYKLSCLRAKSVKYVLEGNAENWADTAIESHELLDKSSIDNSVKLEEICRILDWYFIVLRWNCWSFSASEEEIKQSLTFFQRNYNSHNFNKTNNDKIEENGELTRETWIAMFDTLMHVTKVFSTEVPVALIQEQYDKVINVIENENADTDSADMIREIYSVKEGTLYKMQFYNEFEKAEREWFDIKDVIPDMSNPDELYDFSKEDNFYRKKYIKFLDYWKYVGEIDEEKMIVQKIFEKHENCIDYPPVNYSKFSNADIKGCGNNFPVEQNENDESKSKKNRRVEILFIEPGIHQNLKPQCTIDDENCNKEICEINNTQLFMKEYIDVERKFQLEFLRNLELEWSDMNNGIAIERFFGPKIMGKSNEEINEILRIQELYLSDVGKAANVIIIMNTEEREAFLKYYEENIETYRPYNVEYDNFDVTHQPIKQ